MTSYFEIINQQLQILFIVDTAFGCFSRMDRLWLTANHECQQLDVFCKEILPKDIFGSHSGTVCVQPPATLGS